MGATDGTNTLSFTYDDTGLRQTKTLNGDTTVYSYNGSLLLSEQNSERYIVYIYDENGSPTGFMCRKTADLLPNKLTNTNFDVYNPYSYCFNNPVMYSDHTGNWPSWLTKLIVAVAVVVTVTTVAAITVATAGAGTVAATIAVGAAKGAAIGMATGAAIGATTGYLSTGTLEGTLNGMADGALSGAITGTISGAVCSGVKIVNAAKSWDCGTFKSGYQSMKYHYNEHVVKEGLTKGNNVLKYTRDATKFAEKNSSVLKFTYNYKYANTSWNSMYSCGPGGMFTSAGKIITFWYR